MKDEYKSYYTTGVVNTQVALKNGEYHGAYRSYFTTGAKLVESTYVDGKLHGEYYRYYTNGQIFQHYNYKDGDRHGMCIHYNIFDGEIVKKAYFYHGIIIDDGDIVDLSNPTPEELVMLNLKYGDMV